MVGIEKIARRVDWGDYAVFLAIAHFGSISKAAENLGKSQPTISKRIENMESRLGVALFDRSSSGMTLTSTGEALFERAEAMNRSAKDIENLSARYDDGIKGDVTLHCHDLLSTYWIVPNVADFQVKNPQINLNFYSQIEGYDNRDVSQDLIIQFTREKPMDFQAWSLGTVHFMPMVTQKYEDVYGLPRNANDAVNHKIMYWRRTGLKTQKWKQQAALLRELLKPNVNADSAGLILNAVLNGVGISMLPTFLANRHPELKILDYDMVHSYSFWLVHNSHLASRGRVEIVQNWLQDIFNPKTNPWFATDFIHPREFCDNEIVPPH